VSAGIVATACGLAWTTVAISQERSAVGARAALEAGRWDDALRLARGATTPWRTLDPFGTPVAFLEGAAHMRSGAADEAIACLERARRHHPNRLVVLNNLGILYATTGRTDDAIECLSVAASRYPHRLESVTNLAGCYLDAGRPTDAVSLIEGVPETSRTPVMREHLARARSLLGLPAGAPSDTSQPAAER
jgi:Flp pilus assembly protein TadD